MSKKMILSGLVGAAITAGVGVAAWVGLPIFDHNEEMNFPITNLDNHPGPQSSGYWADFNQDGYMDLLTQLNPSMDGVNQNHLAIYLNVGGEELVEVWHVSESQIMGNAGDWRPVDFNGDGFPDLVNALSNKIIYNTLGPNYACSSDLDKDGATAIGDLLFIIDRWGACGDS